MTVAQNKLLDKFVAAKVQADKDNEMLYHWDARCQRSHIAMQDAAVAFAKSMVAQRKRDKRCHH